MTSIFHSKTFNLTIDLSKIIAIVGAEWADVNDDRLSYPCTIWVQGTTEPIKVEYLGTLDVDVQVKNFSVSYAVRSVGKPLWSNTRVYELAITETTLLLINGKRAVEELRSAWVSYMERPVVNFR